jgi:hypothetical protein
MTNVYGSLWWGVNARMGLAESNRFTRSASREQSN